MGVVFLTIYLLLALATGVLCQRKVHSADDYYVAGRRAGVLQVAGSLVATILGSSAILGSIEFARKSGWAGAWMMVTGACGLLVLSLLVKQLERFQGYNLPELLGEFYGQTVRKWSAVVIAIAWLGVVAAQLIGAAEISTAMCGVSYWKSLFVIGGVLVFYTAAGGQFSILKTDLVQAILVLVGILMVFCFTLTRNGAIPSASGLFSEKFSTLDLGVLLLAYATTYVAGPDIYSRLFCAKDASTSRKALWMAALTLIPVGGMLAYIGIYGGAAYPEHNGSVLLAIAQYEFHPAMSMLLYLALLSAILSSADTTLFNAGGLLAQFFDADLRSFQSIRRTRGCIILLGGASIVIALFLQSILTVLLGALAIYAGAFIVPVLWGLFGLRANRGFVLAAILAGGMLALGGKFLPTPWGQWVAIAAFIANLTLLWVGHSHLKRCNEKNATQS
ncbi:MAG: sodium:solute symporter family protein [Victivallales bacterium]|nr:sodium:solute symporter family protein [Victivallales bacterium]